MLTILGHNGALFTWPLIAAYAIGDPMVDWGFISGATYGAVWVIALMIVLSALTNDFNRTATAILVGVVVIIIGGLHIIGKDWLGHSILGPIFRWFAGLDVPHPKDAAMLIALGCVLAIVWDAFRSRLNDYWAISQNQIDHFVGGESDVSFPRSQTTYTTNYPDTLRAVLLLTGNITFRHPGSKDPYVIKNVIGCPFVARRLRKVLEALATTDVNTDTATAAA